MELPFTAQQFFDIFRQYNEAVWPGQIVLNLPAFAAFVFWIRPRPSSGKIISAILAALWTWTGIVYHLIYFSTINKLAYGFGAIFLLGAFAFLWAGVVKGGLQFISTDKTYRLLGVSLFVFALFIYPALSMALGHPYPEMPTFGLPCPTTIFTIAMLCFLEPPYPRYIFIAPILWAVVGTQAAFLLGVYQDLGLLVAGIAAGFLMWRGRRVSS